jgi:pimeloyl-ACP methyl ester carboxylesterase
MITTSLDQPGGRRPAVLLLHSSGSSARQWDALAKMLEPAFCVRTVEFHGHGARPGWHGDRPLTLADDAALALPLLQEAGAAHVVGHSYGGAVALKLATMAPQRILSLVAFEPVLFGWLIGDDPHGPLAESVIRWGEAIGRDLAQGDDAGAARRFVDFWAGAGAWSRMPERQQRSIAGRMRAVQAHFTALCDEPMRPSDFARLSAPMLFLAGAKTVAATRCIAGLLRRAFPSAGHHVLEAMGHMGPITHAEAVNRCIASHLMSRVDGDVPAAAARLAA